MLLDPLKAGAGQQRWLQDDIRRFLGLWCYSARGVEQGNEP
jgi:hypothetical protein